LFSNKLRRHGTMHQSTSKNKQKTEAVADVLADEETADEEKRNT